VVGSALLEDAGTVRTQAGGVCVMSAFTLTEGSLPHRAGQFLGWAVGIGIIVYLPYHSGFAPQIDRYSQVGAIAVAILGLNLVIGYGGAVALGHSVFVGIGAYTTVILVADHDWNYFAALPLSFAICFVVGVLLGVPALRIRGFYIAILTFGLAIVFPAIIIRAASLTGGANVKEARNMLVPPSWTPWDAHDRAGPPTYRYFVIVTVAAVMFLVARNLVRSRVGRALIAQRDDQTSAAAFGVNLALYRTLIFGMSTAFAGVAGSLLMIQKPVATVGQFDVDLAIYLFVGLMVGGVGTISGAIPGAIVFVFVPLYTSEWSREFSDGRIIAPAGMLYGVLLFIVAFVAPGGVIDGIRRVRTRIVRIVPNPSWRSRAASVESADPIEAEAVRDEHHVEAT
jgi:branched-chain amino acid transport system permease protein